MQRPDEWVAQQAEAQQKKSLCPTGRSLGACASPHPIPIGSVPRSSSHQKRVRQRTPAPPHPLLPPRASQPPLPRGVGGLIPGNNTQETGPAGGNARPFAGSGSGTRLPLTTVADAGSMPPPVDHLGSTTNGPKSGPSRPVGPGDHIPQPPPAEPATLQAGAGAETDDLSTSTPPGSKSGPFGLTAAPSASSTSSSLSPAAAPFYPGRMNHRRCADSDEASSSKNNLSFEYSSTKVVIEDNTEVSGFNKDLARSNVSGTYSSSIEAVQSRQLDYSHFISLPLAPHQDLVDKLNHFQSSILGEEDSDKGESRSEGSIDEMDDDHKQADGSSVSIKLQVQEEESAEAKMGSKGSQSDFGIDKSIFIKPKTFHLTVLMLKLWNKDRIAKASDVLQSVSTQVNEALENRPISIQLRGLTCMKGSPDKARVVYAPVLEVGGEGRLARACIITDAFVKSGLVFQRDVRELKLHATMMNVRHRKSTNKRNQWEDSFDARDIFRNFEKEWGEYPIREVHLSQRFKFDKSGYYYRCSSIPLPTETHTE